MLAGKAGCYIRLSASGRCHDFPVSDVLPVRVYSDGDRRLTIASHWTSNYIMSMEIDNK